MPERQLEAAGLNAQRLRQPRPRVDISPRRFLGQATRGFDVLTKLTRDFETDSLERRTFHSHAAVLPCRFGSVETNCRGCLPEISLEASGEIDSEDIAKRDARMFALCRRSLGIAFWFLFYFFGVRIVVLVLRR